MFDHFGGRVIQIIEALDYGDAVSNQVLNLDKMFKTTFGLDSEIYTKYTHDLTKNLAKSIVELDVDESDILLFHFSGYASTAETIADLKCTKVFVYHNITPHHYFDSLQKEYALCKDGREQLKKIIHAFHFYIADSQFNLDELIVLGIDKTKSVIVPIIVDKSFFSKQASSAIKYWLFVGRIAPNKRQDVLIDQFYQYLNHYGKDHQLMLVGNYSINDWYFQKLIQKVKDYQLQDQIIFSGKVSDQALEHYYQQADVFVCASEHEGFCVPLVEALYYHIPVIAVEAAAIPETLAGSAGLVTYAADIGEKVNRIFCDNNFRKNLIEKQNEISKKYSFSLIAEKVGNMLLQLIPQKGEYKTISIAICTYNRADFLDRCLDYLHHQTTSCFEVIVINGPSTDNTEDILAKYEGKIKIGRVDERNLSKARNIAIEMAAGDIVAFIDDDALPYDNWVERLLSAYNSLPKMVAGVGGATFYAGTLDYQVQDIAVDLRLKTIPNVDKKTIQGKQWFRSALGTNSSFKRERLLALNGFDEQYDYFLDETDLCVRLQQKGFLLYYDANVYLRHEFAQSVNRLGKHNYNWFTIVKNAVYYVLKFNETNSFYKNTAIIMSRLWVDYLGRFFKAFCHREISFDNLIKYYKSVFWGMRQGLRDAKLPRKLRSLKSAPDAFLSYFAVSKTSAFLHVVIITKEFARFTGHGGIGTMYYHLASELLQMGHSVSVITPGEHEEIYQRGQFALYRVPVKTLFSGQLKAPVFIKNINWSYTAAQKVIDIHRKNKIDIIDTPLWDIEGYALSFTQPSFPFIVRLVTPFVKVKEINELNINNVDAELCMQAEKALILKAHKIIAISENIASTLEQAYDLTRDHRWVVQPIGISYWPQFDVNADYSALVGLSPLLGKMPSHTFKALFLGRLEKRKGIDVFLEAAKKILAIRQDIYFIVAGKDDDAWAKTLNHPNVIFLGEISLSNKDKLYAISDVVVFPSRYESFGLVALEAFVHGKPVVASKSGAIPEVVEENSSGLLFEENNADHLSELLLQLKNDQALYKKLSNGAKKRIRTLSARHMANASYNVYGSLL